MPRRKTFLSYHRADTTEVNAFVERFDERHDVFIRRALGTIGDDIVRSTDPDYIMRRIREEYLRDSTVTLVLVGRCTWARKFCDWELQSSLRRGELTTPNGLLGIVLPSAGQQPRAPNRLSINLPRDGEDAYARWHWYPQTIAQLDEWIEDAYLARNARANLIQNPRDRFSNDLPC